MLNVAPYIPQIMNKNEEFLFEHYKEVDLLSNLPLCEFRNIGKPEKEELLNKLHTMIEFVKSFEQFCHSQFDEKKVMSSLISNNELINEGLTYIGNLDTKEMMSKINNAKSSILKNENKSKEVFNEFQKFMPKELLEIGFGQSINSMSDVISIMEKGLQNINPQDIHNCVNELKNNLNRK